MKERLTTDYIPDPQVAYALAHAIKPQIEKELTAKKHLEGKRFLKKLRAKQEYNYRKTSTELATKVTLKNITQIQERKASPMASSFLIGVSERARQIGMHNLADLAFAEGDHETTLVDTFTKHAEFDEVNRDDQEGSVARAIFGIADKLAVTNTTSPPISLGLTRISKESKNPGLEIARQVAFLVGDESGLNGLNDGGHQEIGIQLDVENPGRTPLPKITFSTDYERSNHGAGYVPVIQMSLRN